MPSSFIVLATLPFVPSYLWYRGHTSPGSGVHKTLTVPDALLDSKLAKLVNPLQNPWQKDSWVYTIPRKGLGNLQQGDKVDLTEEEEERVVLARFLKGFFSGKAFVFEDWLLKTFKESMKSSFGLDFVDPANPKLDPALHAELVFWDSALFPSSDYPTYGASFLDVFQLLDSGRDRVYADDSLPRTFSAIGFGSNKPERDFTGVHFFSVERRVVSPKGAEGEGEVVFDLRLWSINTDPSAAGKEGKKPEWLWGGVMTKFHYLYCRALLADGIDAVRRG